MGIRIHKAGMMDTIQDQGRFGFQYWGVNPGGAMDMIALQVANMLAGNSAAAAVIEMHFPAAEIVFDSAAVFALAGADFNAMLDDQPLPVHQPAFAAIGSVLKFTRQHSGSRVYLAVHDGFEVDNWLNSCSTNSKVGAGGYKGRALQKNDELITSKQVILQETSTQLPWQANVADLYSAGPFFFLPGAEYDRLDAVAKEQLRAGDFIIDRNSDRMGYRLKGPALTLTGNTELVSTAVTRGTMQLLPNGQLIVLMADHQTTGGYPRVGHVISAQLSSLSQLRPGDQLRFTPTDIRTAENLLLTQQRNLQQLQNACTFRLQEYLARKS